jgi:nucleotide-binding universal stress UspA family protein
MPDTPALAFAPTRILAPVDFSPSSRAALETAADLAGHFHAQLYLLHVMPIFSSSTLPDFVPEEKFLEQERTEAEAKFTRVREALAAKGLSVATILEEGNDVASNIMEVAEREKIDLLVISTHGLTGWHPLVFGSIAEKVVKMVQCPLLLLRSGKRDAANVPSGPAVEWW